MKERHRQNNYERWEYSARDKFLFLHLTESFLMQVVEPMFFTTREATIAATYRQAFKSLLGKNSDYHSL